jgi:hypothetical protein
MPRLNEFAVFHRASRSLIVADLIFNLDAATQNAVGRWFLRFNKVYGKAGVSRMFRTFIRNRTAFEESLEEIAKLDFKRTVLGHGPNLESKAEFKKAMSEAGKIDLDSRR